MGLRTSGQGRIESVFVTNLYRPNLPYQSDPHVDGLVGKRVNLTSIQQHVDSSARRKINGDDWKRSRLRMMGDLALSLGTYDDMRAPWLRKAQATSESRRKGSGKYGP